MASTPTATRQGSKLAEAIRKAIAPGRDGRQALRVRYVAQDGRATVEYHGPQGSARVFLDAPPEPYATETTALEIPTEPDWQDAPGIGRDWRTVARFAAQDVSARFVLTAVRIEDGHLIATDGRALCARRASYTTFRATVPAVRMDGLGRPDAIAQVAPHWVALRFPWGSLWLRELDGTFPDWNQIMATSAGKERIELPLPAESLIGLTAERVGLEWEADRFLVRPADWNETDRTHTLREPSYVARAECRDVRRIGLTTSYLRTCLEAVRPDASGQYPIDAARDKTGDRAIAFRDAHTVAILMPCLIYDGR